ncbi:MAG: hypothetical protein L0G46_11680, partial [Kocuria sp.]|nr:hypothetical protein [Kocuria sp.]
MMSTARDHACRAASGRTAGEHRRARRPGRGEAGGEAEKMRWDALFADLEAQWEAGAAEERDREIAEAVRAERATVPFADRL